ncbi:TusE/DsrC/DsvC family sulfur relay protein [Gallibacterium anatis]|uniref:Sulfurtransferase n=1 Tax=Gallibacterium anatis TaxID=750 RepID=A0AAX3XDH1_9PAST|nr:TusE/DsrC/DsvC family sulfur relay protein [Gallibacterium anatis]MDK9430464.1 TusE/DsrC/DsvC family sulfur relay protein [Gallibacterium anatis]WIM80236.1 TusE/DsrC/DsvC family sulfur relay protein [Gallibacterium anatis]
MAQLEFNGKKIELDAQGYLLNSADWTPALAEVLAEREQLTLTKAHWEVIHFVRDFYQEYKTSPAIRMLVKAMAQKLGEDKGNSRYLQRLFPDGPAKQATKLAGLPKPAKCL